jgi:hypothetical protein
MTKAGDKADVGFQQCSGVRGRAAGFEVSQAALLGGCPAPFFQQQSYPLRLLAAQHSQEGMGQTG